MFEIPDGYELVSLTESGRNLNRTPWNELTDEFIETCVVPAMDSSEDFSWNLGAREDGPEDWLSQIAVKHLCGSLADGCNPAANWGSPAAKSWLKFLISVHEDGDQLEYGQFSSVAQGRRGMEQPRRHTVVRVLGYGAPGPF